MGFSTYELERMLLHLRRWAGWLGAPLPGDGARDTVRVSARARRIGRPHAAGAARGREGGARRSAAVSPGDVAETAQRPQPVEQELERRAGSFMSPPYPEHPWPVRIPRLRRVARPRITPRKVAEGD